MLCPKCPGSTLQQSLGPSGVIVDSCPACRGVWLDPGEIYGYSGDAQSLFAELGKAYQSPARTAFKCPRCAVELLEVKLAAFALEACPGCRGNWLDTGEAEKLGARPGARAIPVPPPPAAAAPAPAANPYRLPDKPSSAARPAAAALSALPNLGFRSAAVLASLYGILAAFLYLAVALGRFPAESVLLTGIVIVMLQFALGPILYDLSLRWMYAMSWVGLEGLPQHLREFLARACKESGIPIPRIGIIDDGAPNAFTYGQVPSNARLILTRGLIEQLNEGELEAVVGHELGHIRHYDMLVMTLAALVPIVLYYIYKVCMKTAKRPRSSSGKKGGNPLPLIGLVALLLYYVTKFIMLFLSRLREYHADRASGELTGEPSLLASALVKIAYGLNNLGKDEAGKKEENAFAATLGVFDPAGAKALAAAATGAHAELSSQNIVSAMQWDMWNPWAAYYELQSTHPLPAKRIMRLGEQAAAMGRPALVTFDLEKPESYWDEFLVDVLVSWLPFLGAGVMLALRFWGRSPTAFGPDLLFGFGAGLLVQTWRMYAADFYPDASVRGLLKNVKVSAVRGVAAQLKGTVIGRGTPGYVFSEDFVLRDDTGIILIDYKQPLSLWELLFALTSVRDLAGRPVTVRGWYRRAPVPYFELRSFESEGVTKRCWTLEVRYVFSFLLVLASMAWASGLFARLPL